MSKQVVFFANLQNLVVTISYLFFGAEELILTDCDLTGNIPPELFALTGLLGMYVPGSLCERYISFTPDNL